MSLMNIFDKLMFTINPSSCRLLMETLHITCLGRSRQPLEQLISEARARYEVSQRQRTTVHSVDQDGYWAQVGARRW